MELSSAGSDKLFSPPLTVAYIFCLITMTTSLECWWCGILAAVLGECGGREMPTKPSSQIVVGEH